MVNMYQERKLFFFVAQKNHDMYHDVTIFSIFNFYNYFHKGSYFMIDKLL